MHIAPSTVGLLLGLSLLAFLVSSIFRGIELRRTFRRFMDWSEDQVQKETDLWQKYAERIENNMNYIDKPFDGRILLVKLLLFSVAFFSLFVFALHYNPIFGAIVSVLLTLFLVDRYYQGKGDRRRDEYVYSFMNEAVPIGVHVLAPTGDLGLAIEHMAELTASAPMRRRLVILARMTKQPQYVGAHDAFLHWADDFGLFPIYFFALSTYEAVRRKNISMSISDYWIEMSEILSRDIEYRRDMRAHTSEFRKGGYVFYGMLVGVLLVAYPLGSSYVSATTADILWMVILVMTVGLYLIVRESQRIDV